MAYLLRFDGVDDFVSINTPVNVNIGLDAWTFEVEVAFTSTNINGGCVLGNANSAGNDSFQLRQDGRLHVLRNSANAISCNAGFVIFDTVSRVYRIEHDADGAFRFYRDGVLFQSGVYTTNATFVNNLGLIGRYRANVNWFVGMDFRRLSLTGFSNSQVWDANLSGGTGPTLPTVSGSNQGTLLNFTVPAAWVFYDDGGSVSSTTDYDLGDFGFAASANAAAPVFTATVDYDLGAFGFDVSASNSAPLVSADVAYSIGDFGFYVVADNLAPSGSATVIFSIGDFGFAVDANSSAPVFSADAAFDLGDFGFAVVASIASNNESASAAFDIGSFGFAASASVINPPVTATTAFDMGNFGFSVFAT